QGGPGVPAAAELGRRLRVPWRRRRGAGRLRLVRRRGGRRQRLLRIALRREDHHAKVLVDLDDAYHGAERSISLRVPKEGPDGRVVLEERRLDVHIPK